MILVLAEAGRSIKPVTERTNKFTDKNTLMNNGKYI